MIDPATGDAIGGVGPPTLGVNWNNGPTSPLSLREGPTAVRPDGGRRRRGDGQEVRPVRRRHDHDPVRGAAAGVHDLGHRWGSARRTTWRVRRSPRSTRRPRRRCSTRKGSSTRSTSSPTTASRCRTSGRASNRRCPKGVEAVKSSDVADEQAKQLQEALGFFRTALLVFAFIALFVGRVHHLQHVLDHRGAAHAGDGAAPRDRRQPPAGPDLGGGRSVRDRVGRVGAGPRRRDRDRRRAPGLARPRSGSTCRAPALQLEPRTIVVAFVVGTVVTVVSSILPGPPGRARGAGAGAPGVGRQRQRLAPAPVDHRAHRHRRRRWRRSCTGCSGTSRTPAALIGLGAAATFVGIAILLPLGRAPARRGDRGADPPPGRSRASWAARTPCGTPAGRRRRRPRS